MTGVKLRPFSVPGQDLWQDAAYIDAAIQLDPGISARWVFDAIMHHVAELPTVREFEVIKDRMEEAEFQLDEAPSEEDVTDARYDVQDEVAARLRTILAAGDDLRTAVEDLAAELESHDF